MFTPQRKKYLLYFASAVGLGLLFFVGRIIYAQVVVINPSSPMGSPPSGACILGTVTPAGSATPDEAVPAMVMPNGEIYGITGNYNVSLNCTAGDPACDALTTAVDSATEQGNSISGFPQYTDGPSNNDFQINIGNYNGICGLSGECEETTITTINGVNKITANIYIDTSAPPSEESPQELLTNPADFLSVIEHEMGHGFGLADAAEGDQGLMGQGSYLNPPLTWETDDATADAIEQINTGKVTLQNGAYCNNLCGAEHPGTITVWDPTNPSVFSCQQPTCTPNETAAGGEPDANAPGGCSMPPETCIEGYTWNPAAQECESGTGNIAASCSCSGQDLVCTLQDGVSTSYGYNPTCSESGNGAIANSCSCQGSNLVCALQNGSTVSNYNPTCAATPTTPTNATSSDPNATCTTTNDGSQSCTCNAGYSYPSSGSVDLCEPSVDCAADPGNPVCPGNMDYCNENPSGAGCPSTTTPTSTIDCSQNPDDPSCTTPVDCSTNPTDPSCSGSSDYCTQNPTDPDCSNYCASNPEDPTCTGDNPINDPTYCQENPDDPSCDSILDGAGGSGDGGGGGDGDTCVPEYATVDGDGNIISYGLSCD